MIYLQTETPEGIIFDLKAYRGNTSLKKAGEKIEWSHELLTEYVKCSQDPIYFIEKYVKIVNLDEGFVSIKLYDYQKDMILSYINNRFTICTTARQVGKTTATFCFILWYIIFNSDKTVAILANRGETAIEILHRVKIAYQDLPKWLQQGVLEGGWNSKSISLENGSRVLADSSSSTALRGYSINVLFLDEVAFHEHWEQFESSVLPTISSSKTSKVIMVSTPNGLNYYWKYWQEAQPGFDKPNGYNPIMVKWNQVPGRDKKWYDDTLQSMGGNLEKFAQEYEVEFMGSSGTLIAGWKLKELVHQLPIYQKDGLSKYSEKIKDHTYVITVDVSEGKGFDYSAFNVIDITQMPYIQVCTFRSNLIAPSEFSQIIHSTAIGYNNAAVLIEYESLGPEVSDTLFNDLSYENVLHTESAGARGKRISMMSGRMIDRGIKMSVSVKATGCSLLKLLIEQNQLIINDYNTIEELSRFSRKNKTWAAEEGWNDDLVMSLVVFSWLSNQDYFKEMTDINTLGKLREHTEAYIEDQMTPFGFMPDVEEIPKVNRNDPWALAWKQEEYLKEAETLANF